MNTLSEGVMLLAATFASEDAATLTAGALAAAGSMPAMNAIAWVALGIWLGDLGLFAIGRLTRRSPVVARWVDRRWPRASRLPMEARFNRGAAFAVLASRFLPGTRVLLYVAAGGMQVRTSTFAISAAIACVAWTSVLVSAVASVGALW